MQRKLFTFDASCVKHVALFFLWLALSFTTLSCSAPMQNSIKATVKAISDDSSISWEYRLTPIFEPSGIISEYVSGIKACSTDEKPVDIFLPHGRWHVEAEGKLLSGTAVYRGQTEQYVNPSDNKISVPVSRILRTKTEQGVTTSTVLINLSTNEQDSCSATVSVDATDLYSKKEYDFCEEKTADGHFNGSLILPSGDYVLSATYTDRNGRTGGFAKEIHAVAGETYFLNEKIRTTGKESESGFIAASRGGTCISSDAKIWSETVQENVPGPWNDIGYGNSLFVACGGSVISLSTDGHTFHSAASYEKNIRYMSVSYGNGKWVVCGDSGTIAVSEDGETWTRVVESSRSVSYRSVMYSNGIWTVVGYATSGSSLIAVTAYSSDGNTWIVSEHEDTGALYCQGYFNGTWTALGKGGTVVFSSDGKSWNKSSAGTDDWLSVTYGGGFFLAVSSGNTAYSEDGITWTVRTTGYTSMKDTAFSNSTWVILMSYSVLVSASCFGPWTEYPCNNSIALKSICNYER